MNYFIKPWKHQLKAIEKARKFRDFALLFDMGTGKTGTAINIVRELCATEKRLLRTLVLCPVIVVNNWKREFKMHSKISPQDVICLAGAGAKRAELFSKSTTDDTGKMTGAKVFITNYEAMEMDELYKLIQTWSPEVLICDEAHRLKNHQSVRAKRVVGIADHALHRYILTGTPILNSAMDIFNQYRILDSGQTFSVSDPDFPGGRRPMNFYEFRAIYFEDQNKGMPSNVHFPKWVPRAETYEELNKKIYKKAMRVLKTECLDLPPLIRQRVDVTMGKEQARIYKDMKTEYIAWVNEHEKSGEPRAVVAQMALTKILRLQQIVSGFCKTEDGKEITLKDNPRIKVLADLLEDITPAHKVIVWACFKENYRAIENLCDKLHIKFCHIYGGVKDVAEQERLFRTDPTYRVMVANQRAGGIGINLVEDGTIVEDGQSAYSLFYSKGASLADDLQAESRNHRGGAEVYKNVVRIDLVTPNTVDELFMESLKNKQEISNQILDWKDIL
jgi:SNF2 family DNA or RNA helicase